jgi:hypothetical protein
MKAHVAEVCFKYFGGMLQLFNMDIAKVDRECCKCFRGMLRVFQKFVQNISSIPDVCCKRSDLDVAYVSHICYNYMFQMFQSYLSVSDFHVASVFIWMLHIFHTYVATVCSRWFICFIHILSSSVSYSTCFMLFGELGAWAVMVPRYGCREMGSDELGASGRGALGASGWGAMGTGSACGVGLMALNRGGQDE